MTVRMPLRHAAAALAALAAVSLMLPRGAGAASTDEQLVRLHERLSEWNLGAAAPGVEALLAADPDRPEVRALGARLKHMQRDFEGAAALLEPICDEDERRADDGSLCAVVYGSLRATAGFVSRTSPDGRFVLHFRPGPDEVLVPYAAETLDGAARFLGAQFGWQPADPVHVDILPTVEGLAAMTPLTRAEIEASGTIAMCKYDRMMVVSPRDLVYGYGWRDTLAHEYIHHLLTKRSANRVPLWLHEGLAKYFERGWVENAEPALAPPTEHLLAEALAARKLIPLEKLHPSIGKLPTQDDAALAFAQVYTLVDWMVGKDGLEGINRLLDQLGAGDSLDDALVAVYGLTFRQLEQTWRTWLARRSFRRIPDGFRPKLLFRGKDRGEDEIAEIREERGRDHTYLGDLLRGRGRHDAALVEYGRAVVVVGGGNPVLQSKIAAAQLALGQFDGVLATVAPVLQSYPHHVLLHLYRGEALLRLGRPQEALPAFVAAVGLNPFDPQVHTLLAETWEALGYRERAAFERRQQTLVMSE
jgi:tetratricopeptide (TPR) repeat protein